MIELSHSAPTPQALRIAKLQRIQDFLFHGITQFFALSVLLALLGIIVSLFINAWPALDKFGIGFFQLKCLQACHWKPFD
jgi:phosphate transport system permease protein